MYSRFSAIDGESFSRRPAEEGRCSRCSDTIARFYDAHPPPTIRRWPAPDGARQFPGPSRNRLFVEQVASSVTTNRFVCSTELYF